MKARGKTIIFVSHDTGSVVNLCDRAIWIADGKMHLSGSPAEITEQYRAYLFGLEIKNQPLNNRIIDDSAPADFRISAALPEQHIPNADRRMGDQSCKLLGVGMYNPRTLCQITEIKSGGEFLLRMSFLNESLAAGTPLIVGYTLRSPKGEEISSNNSEMEGVTVSTPKVGQTLTVRAHIILPTLHTGNYALSVAVAATNGVEFTTLDSVENVLVFCVTETVHVFGLLRFSTLFSVEQFT
jgi:hypothetical protein